MPAWAPERGSSTPTLSVPPWARTIAGSAIAVVTAAAPASKRRRFNAVDALRVTDMAHSPKDWTLAFMVVARGPARQAAGLRLWSALEALLDRNGDVEQSYILDVSPD